MSAMGGSNRGGASRTEHASAFVGDPREGTLVGLVGPVLFSFISGPSVDGCINAQVEGARRIVASSKDIGLAVVLGPNAGFPNKAQRQRIVEAFRPWAKRGAPVMYHVTGGAFRVAVIRSIFTSMTLTLKAVPGAMSLSINHDDDSFARTVERKTGLPSAEVFEVMQWARRTLRQADPSYL